MCLCASVKKYVLLSKKHVLLSEKYVILSKKYVLLSKKDSVLFKDCGFNTFADSDIKVFFYFLAISECIC